MKHKLKVFRAVAELKSFTEAANYLNMSQPAVSKTIKNLEQEYGNAFFLREGNNIHLTPEGATFLKYCLQLLDLYDQLSNELSSEDPSLPQQIKLGASTTLGQYVLPKIAAKLQKEQPALHFQLISGNTNEIQTLLLNRHIDLGVVEGDHHNSRLHYEAYVKDELVLVTSAKNVLFKKDFIELANLKNLHFVERETGSGTREVIENALRKHKVQPLHISAVLGSTESIKSYLRHSNHFAFLSIHSIHQEVLSGQLRVVEVEDFSVARWFHFVTRQGFQSKLNQKLQNILRHGYNQTE